jgi:hypothetical protein
MATADPTTSTPDAEEDWRDIPGFTGYQISDIPRVRSSWRVKPIRGRGERGGGVAILCKIPHLLTIHTNPRGYHYVRIKHDSGRSSNQQVHRLVLLAFVGPCPRGREGCHVDGNPTNNVPSNLYWGTRKDNCIDTLRHGRNRNAKLTVEQGDEVIRLHAEGWIIARIADRFGLRHCSVSGFLQRRGQLAYRPRLAPELIREIIGMRESGLTYGEISRQTGIKQGTVARAFRLRECP